MAHTVKTLAIFCSDFRQNQAVVAALKKKYGVFDLLVFPGAGLPVLMKDSKKIVVNWIKTLYQLHGFQRIMIIDHTDCGAYKLTYGKKAHNPKTEEVLHSHNANRLKTMISKDKVLKNLTIFCFLYDIHRKKLKKLAIK